MANTIDCYETGASSRTLGKLWARLPPELQGCVWHHAIRGPRVHRLRYRFHGSNLEFLPSETLPRSTQSARSVLATSKAAYENVLRMLLQKIHFANGGMLRFNARRDVVCLVGVKYSLICKINDTMESISSLACARNLDLKICNTSFQNDFFRIHLTK